MIVEETRESEVKKFIEKHRKLFPDGLKSITDMDEFVSKVAKNGRVYFFQMNDENIGAIVGYMNDLETYIAYVSLLVVLPQHRGKQIGKKLLAHFEKCAKEKMMRMVKLTVLRENQSAYKLYLRSGFKIIDEDEDRYLLGKKLTV